MQIEIDQQAKRVLSLLGEREMPEYIMEGRDLGSLIKELLPIAAREIILSASVESLGDSLSLTGIRLNADRRIKLPENFLRLIYFRMADWPTGTSSAMNPAGELYSLRGARRGRMSVARRRPGVALLPGNILEVFGSESDSVAELLILIEPEVSPGKLEIPAGIIDEVAKCCAIKVSAICSGRSFQQ